VTHPNRPGNDVLLNRSRSVEIGVGVGQKRGN
jgi:hypothetical protein